MVNYLRKITSFSDLSEAEKEEDGKDLKDFQKTSRKAISKVEETVKSHRVAADYLDSVWMKCKTAYALGSFGGVVGGCLTIAGGIATLATAGAAAPLLLAGTGIGVAGAGTNVLTSFAEAAINSSEIKKADKDLQETLNSIHEIKEILNAWLVKKDERRLSYIRYLAELTLKFSDPAVMEILQAVLPSLGLSPTEMKSYLARAMAWAAAQAVAKSVVEGLTQVGAQAAVRGGVMEGVKQASARAAGSLFVGVGAVFAVLDGKNLNYTIKEIVENKGSDAARFLREKADELENAISFSSKDQCRKTVVEMLPQEL